MEEGIDKEYAELASLMRKLHGVFNDKKFRTASRTVLDGLERAHEVYDKLRDGFIRDNDDICCYSDNDLY